MNDQADAFVKYLTNGGQWSLERFRTQDVANIDFYYMVGPNRLTDTELTERAKKWLESKGSPTATEEAPALAGAVLSKLDKTGTYPTPKGGTK